MKKYTNELLKNFFNSYLAALSAIRFLKTLQLYEETIIHRYEVFKFQMIKSVARNPENI